MASYSSIRIVIAILLLVLHTSALLLSRVDVPNAWVLANSSGNAEQLIALQVILPLSNIEQLEPLLYSISTPGSPRYRKFLDIQDTNAIFVPSPQCAASVVSWLSTAGATNIYSDGNTVNFEASIQIANRLLNATFREYQDTTGTTKVRTTQYSIPDNMTDYIDFITPTTYFGTTSGHLARPVAVESPLSKRADLPIECSTTFNYEGQDLDGVGPDCLKVLYSIDNYQPDARSGSTIGFGSFLNESASYDDLAQYETYFNITQQSFNVTLINAGVNAQPPTRAREANLDVQNLIGVGHPLPVTEFITGGSPYVTQLVIYLNCN